MDEDVKSPRRLTPARETLMTALIEVYPLMTTLSSAIENPEDEIDSVADPNVTSMSGSDNAEPVTCS